LKKLPLLTSLNFVLGLLGAVLLASTGPFGNVDRAVAQVSNGQTEGPGQQVGDWHLDIVTTAWSSTRLPYSTPATYIGMGDQSKNSPRDYQGEIDAPNSQTKLEFDTPVQYTCVAGVAASNGCAFIDFINLVQLSDQKITYTARKHGGRCGVTLRIYQRSLVNESVSGNDQPWIMGKSFLVFVPANAIDATVVGTLGGNAVFFTPSDPLTGDDAKRFAVDQPAKSIPGVGTYYSFRVVNPNP
jgi:hypothetical protein